MDMSNITFEFPRLSTFSFKSLQKKKVFTIILVFGSLKGFDWNNVCPASQTVAQDYFTLGPMYVLSGYSGFSVDIVSPVWQSEQKWDNHPNLFQCWASIEYD